MRIYKDIFSGDELCSDSFPMKLVDDTVYEFKGKHVTRKEGAVVLAGANASEEEAPEEGSEEAVERGVDVVLNHRLQNMQSVFGDIKQFKEWAKEYMKKLLDHMKKNEVPDEEISKFKKNMQAYIGSLIKKERFKTLEFYMGDGENAMDGQLAILEYRDVDGNEVPTLMLVKAGVDEEKQ